MEGGGSGDRYFGRELEEQVEREGGGTRGKGLDVAKEGMSKGG